MGAACCSDVRIPVCVIVMLFGMGSWIAINGIWVELPILVDVLPEGWNLPSYMTVIIQIANIAPILYTVINVCAPDTISERPVVYIMVVVGMAASLLMAFFWRETSYVGGEERSTALLILMFFLSLVDCTSSVVFLPFMNVFKPQYMTSYYVGEGFSGLVPSLVSLAQGVGQIECVNVSMVNTSTNITDYHIQGQYLPARFAVREFFYFIFAMMGLCGLAFILLNHLPYCKAEHADRNTSSSDKSDPSVIANGYEMDASTVGSSTQHIVNTTEQMPGESSTKSYQLTFGPISGGTSDKRMSRLGYIYFLTLIAWVNALTNGVLLSIQSYACLPYGTQPYHLSVTLANIANPVACFIAFFVNVTSAGTIGMVTLTGSVISGYILALAVLSPTPPLVDSDAGPVLVVVAYVLVYLLLTFTKVTIAGLFRLEGHRALLWCGAITQLGSAVGSIVMFVTVNVYELFEQKYPCT